jgi:hypothetical protein
MRGLPAAIGAVWLALAAASPLARAQAPAPAAPAAPAPVPTGRTFEGLFTIGAAAAGRTGELARAGEYLLLEDTGAVAAEIWGGRAGVHFDASARHGGDARWQRYAATLDVDRFVKVHAGYLRFPHRLDHDPLGYMDAVSTIGGTFAVTSFDTDPAARYALARGEWEGRIDVTLPAGVSFFLGHRLETRDGAHQVMTVSHCATCHTTAYTRRLDERTRDLTAGARLALDRLTVDYQFENRRFDDAAQGLTHVYSLARHPATLADVFLGRVQYDARDGALPVATVPGVRKDTHHLRASLLLPREASLTGTFTHSEGRNLDTDLRTEFTGSTGRLVLPLGRKLTLRADLRRYDIRADSVFVDVVEPVTPAGPNAGLTYAQAYPEIGPQDYVRESVLSRTPTELGLELLYRPARKTWVRFGYGWESVRRDAFEVHETTTNTVSVLARTDVGKRANLRVRFELDDIQDPFMYERAAIPQVLQPFASPGNLPFTGLQYATMYDSRQADLTAYPTRQVRFEPTFTWTPNARVSVTGHYRLRRGENDELNFSSWERTAQSPGLDLWLAPGERWTLAAGYQYQRERLETLFSTLAFVG